MSAMFCIAVSDLTIECWLYKSEDLGETLSEVLNLLVQQLLKVLKW